MPTQKPVVGPTGRLFARELEAARPGGFFRVYGSYAARIPEVQWSTLAAAMHGVAQQLQKQALEELKATRVRPESLSTGRLVKALSDPKQVLVVTTDGKPRGFGFGNIAELDRGPAGWYWRHIEEGTSRFVGHEWLASFGSGRPAVGQGGKTRFPPPVLAKSGGGWEKPVKGARTGKMLPWGWRAKAGRSKVKFGRATIRRPITAHRYMQNAWKTVGVARKMDDALVAWAAANGLPLSRVSVSRSTR
jgi:hypothetical protein